MSDRNASQHLATELQKWMKRENWTQTLLAEKLDIHQSQVSRITRGEFIRQSPAVRKLCEFARIDIGSINKKYRTPHLSKKLRQALYEVWDGTKQHEDALLKIIKSLGYLK